MRLLSPLGERNQDRELVEAPVVNDVARHGEDDQRRRVVDGTKSEASSAAHPSNWSIRDESMTRMPASFAQWVTRFAPCSASSP